MIEEGIRQLKKNGLDGFSARSVAEACHVSCAAPFKYFHGRREIFSTISKKLDMELLESMQEIGKKYPEAYKEAHLAMNEVYIRCLLEYPFLLDQSFWHSMDERQSGIRKWESFQLMTDQFRLYCRQHGIGEALERAYYFNFQALAYGSAFVINSGLMLEDEQPEHRIRDLQQRIYANLEKTAGIS